MKKYLITAAAFALLTTAAQAETLMPPLPPGVKPTMEYFKSAAARGALHAQARMQQEDAIAFVNRDCNQWAAAQPTGVTPGALPPDLLAKLQQKDYARNFETCERQKQLGKEQVAAQEAQARAQAALDAQQAAQREAERRAASERQIAAQEEAARQAAEAAKPINRLYRGYQYYAHIKFCNEVREGYLVKYVNDVELERAEIAIKAIVAQTTKEDAAIDTDDVWKKALKAVVGQYAEADVCKNSLVQLFKMSPQPVYQIAKP
jgi:hypothetical protein